MSETDDQTPRRPPTIELAATEVDGSADKAAAGEADAGGLILARMGFRRSNFCGLCAKPPISRIVRTSAPATSTFAAGNRSPAILNDGPGAKATAAGF